MPGAAVLCELNGVLCDAQFRVLPRAVAALARLHRRGVVLAVVSDQPAIGRGELSEVEFAQRCADLRAMLGSPLAGCWHCPSATPHRERKPRPGLILRALRDLGVDPAQTWFIGTTADDARAAGQAGLAGCVLVAGGVAPAEDLGLVVASATDLADAPRVMIPKGGGCWHDLPS